MRYRTTAVFIATLGVMASWLLPGVILAIHDASGISVAAELRIYHLLDPVRVEEMQARFSEDGYSVEQRVRSVGALDVYLPLMSCILSGLFAALGYLSYRSVPVSSDADALDDEAGD